MTDTFIQVSHWVLCPKSEPKVFLGRVEGQIALKKRLILVLLFDPLFYVEEEGKTFGELTTEEKPVFS